VFTTDAVATAPAFGSGSASATDSGAMKIAALLAPFALVATLAPAATAPPRIVTARIGETVRLQRLAVTPLRVVEDSRCPQNARCVWAGRVRLSVRIAGSTPRILTLGEPLAMAGGELRLVGVLPERTTRSKAIAPRDYRFALQFERTRGAQFERTRDTRP